MKVNLEQEFQFTEMLQHGPFTVGALREVLEGIPDSAPVLMCSDEEGNSVHALWAVEIGAKDKTIVLRPAGDDLGGF